MSFVSVIREAINDDITHLASTTRIALLSATWTLSIGLLYGEFMFAVQLALGVRGVEGWVTIINHLCICLAAVLSGYAAKMIVTGAFKRQPDVEKEPENG